MADAKEPMITTSVGAEQRVSLSDVQWETFQALLHDVGPARGRLAFDQGQLEIMSPSYDHETLSRLLGLLVHALTDELGIAMRSAGSTTLERADQQRAVEPDECFYIGRHAEVSDRLALDLVRDPPPDLVIEVDISRSSRVRMAVYAALGVPEVWRWSGSQLEILTLQPSGGYQVAPVSGLFPLLPVGEIAQFLGRRRVQDDNAIVRAFRLWVREGFRNPRSSERPQ